jgi:protein-L-isoaspartate(D-aspartate) O-methyltransferase
MLASADARDRMVERQLIDRDIRDERVLAAMREVPRESFVDEDQRTRAYDDRPLPIGDGQTISQPYIVALMAEAARLTPASRVLEVGTGSGYAAAVLSRLADRVCTIERHVALAEIARERLSRLGYRNVAVRVGDGSKGWLEDAPFNAIIVSAGAPAVPAALKGQLAPGGRIIIPTGDRSGQQLVMVTRQPSGEWQEELLCPVSFVPLIGEQGWKDNPTQ